MLYRCRLLVPNKARDYPAAPLMLGAPEGRQQERNKASSKGRAVRPGDVAVDASVARVGAWILDGRVVRPFVDLGLKASQTKNRPDVESGRRSGSDGDRFSMSHLHPSAYPVVVPVPVESRRKLPPEKWQEVASRARSENLRSLANVYGVSHEAIRQLAKSTG